MTRAWLAAVVASALASALALAACASPPLVWHTLVKPAASVSGIAAAPDNPRAVNHVFEFAVPGVPAQVDRSELVLTDAATRQVSVLEGERWLASLPEEVRAALARGYARASGARDVTGLPRPQGVPVLRVRTMLRRFEIGGGRVALDAEWSLQLAGDDTRNAPLCRWSSTATARGASPDADVRAMQELVDALAATIAAKGSAWVADAATSCPALAETATLRG
jgi:uncharacterized protein